MRRFTLLFAALLCVVIAKAQSYAAATFTYSDDGKTCTITNGTDGSINLDADQSDRAYASEIAKIKNNCTKVIIDGEVKSLNAFQNNTNAPTYVDMSNATFVDWNGNATAGSGFSGFKNVQTAIIPNNETSTSNQYFQNCNNLTTIQYKDIVATGSGNNFSFTESGNNTDDRFFENLLTNNGKSVKVIKATKTTWDAETGTLTVSKTDGTGSKLKEIVESADYCNGKENVNKIVFSDGSIWEKSTGKLTAYSEAEAHQAALVTAGFTVESTSEVQIIGNYVKIIDGVTIVTDPLDSSAGLETWLSEAEIAALGSATNLKLVGNVGSNAMAKIGAGSTPSTVDLKEAVIAQGTVGYTYYYIVETQNDKGQTIKSKYVIQEDGIYKIGGEASVGGGASTTLTKVEGATVESLGIDIDDKYIFKAEVKDGQALPSDWNECLTTLYLPEDENYNVVGYKFANSFTNLSNINIPDNVKVIGDEAFYSTNISSVDLNKVEVFCEQSFYQSKLTSVTLPYTTTYVGREAFDECNNLKTVIFANNPDKEADSARKITVKDRAFFNSKAITDVYIKTLALADCENGAFDYYNTWGHGDPTKALTTLHFASEVASHYANLSHPLTPEIAKDPGRYHQWLGEHFSKAAHPGANGWWEFVNNGTSSEEDDIPGDPETGKILRTFSDYHYDRIVPQGMKAYIVTGLQENNGDYTLNLLSLLVIPKRTGVILYGVPNSTNDKNNKILSMPLCEIANGVPLRRDYWDYLSETDKTLMSNYLWPTCVELSPSSYVEENYWQYDLDENGNINIDDDGDYKMELKTRSVLKEAEGNSNIKPYDNQNAFTEPDKEEEHYNAGNLNGFFRNFLMNRYGNTDSGKKYEVANGGIESNYVGFFRAKKKSQMKPGMAYLRLNDKEYKNPNGGEAIIIGDVKPYDNNMKYYQIEYDKDGNVIPPSESGYWKIGGNPNMEWEDNENWGDRTKVTEKPEGQGNAKFMAVTFYGEPEIIDNGDGTATMIVPSSMIQKEESGVYYNLQGVKVANPTKGIYIKNGKKIVLK